MATLIVTIVFCILIACEYLAFKKILHSEVVRKLVHMGVGTFVAFWPFFLGWQEIQLLSVAFFFTVLISAKFKVFKAIHRNEGGIGGELLFALVIGVLALMQPDEWIFTIAMLHLSLADGLAAIIGVYWGRTNHYRVFGKVKSVAGSMAFLIASFCILTIYVAATSKSPGFSLLILLPIIATVVEGVSVRGTDNLAVPLIMTIALTF